MPAMPGSAAQPRGLQALGELTHRRNMLEQFRGHLKEGMGIVALTKKLRMSEAFQDHIERDWLAPDGWWPHLAPIEPILQAGLLYAAELCLDNHCTAEVLWICGLPDVQVVSHLGKPNKQVTTLLLTPPPAGVQPNTTEVEPVYITRRGKRNEDEILVQRHHGQIHTYQMTGSQDEWV